MKKFFMVFAAFLAGSLLWAQVKNYVGVVRQNIFPESKEFLEGLRDDLKKRGYASYAEYVEGYLSGGFGSGFVYVDASGANYVVTNRHVVSQAQSASIEFEDDDGSVVKYDNLSVLITDDDIDLAILKFDGGKNPFKKGLQISSSKVYDGQDVFSAGFPGLGAEPVWQFGKGNISNSAARIKDLLDPSISTVIQHSAQIDAGNSGGPLLTASRQAAAGYEVVGVNSWKAVGRESTNFAIPARLVLSMIEKSKLAADDEAAKKARSEKFKALLTDSSSDWTSIVKFISYKMAASEGKEKFVSAIGHAPSNVKNRIAAEFAGNPVEGLRCSCAYYLFNELSDKNGLDEKMASFVWTKESGLWRLSSTEENDGKKSKSQKEKSSSEKGGSKKSAGEKASSKVSFLGIESPYLLSVNPGLMIPLGHDAKGLESKAGFDMTFQVFPGRLGLFGVGGTVRSNKIGGNNYTAFGPEVFFRLPFNFDLFCVSPKVGGGIAFSFGSERIMQAFAEAGLEAAFNFGLNFFRPGIEAGVRGESSKLKFSNFADDINDKSASFFVRLVAAFNFD